VKIAIVQFEMRSKRCKMDWGDTGGLVAVGVAAELAVEASQMILSPASSALPDLLAPTLIREGAGQRNTLHLFMSGSGWVGLDAIVRVPRR
jgi:hypothetical protein